MNQITNTQLSYIAGIIDGEGCIGLYAGKSSYGNIRYNAKLLITNTNTNLLNWLKDTTGLGNIYKNFVTNTNWKQAYRWEVCPNSMRELLPLISQYLIVKKNQCDIILQYLSIQDYKNNQELVKELVDKLKILNKRGVDHAITSS